MPGLGGYAFGPGAEHDGPGPSDFDVADRVMQIATERDGPPAQIALAWLLQRPGVSAPIIGATKSEHVHDALAAERLTLSDPEVSCLEELYVPHSVLGHE